MRGCTTTTIYATDVVATWLKAGLTIPTSRTFWSHAKNNWSISAQRLLKQGENMTEEDEAFNEIERQAKQRKEAVKAAINKEKPMNNPPAFPAPAGVSHITEQGMTLRDYFAAQAMNAFLSRPGSPFEKDAEYAYKMADAMMKAREA
jgi:hypothetical protein